MRAVPIKYFRPLLSGPCCLAILVLSAFWPVGANRGSELRHPAAQPLPAPPRQLESTALERFSRRVRRYGYDLGKQGILVESQDGRAVLAKLNTDIPLNPASVMKLVTSLVALARLGPDYRFITQVYGDSPIDQDDRVLPGNLYLVSDGNPLLSRSELYRLARSLKRRGLRRVTGDLVIAGPFTINSSNNPNFPVRYLARYFRRTGIRIDGRVYAVPKECVGERLGIEYLSHSSPSLRDILWKVNAFSVNNIADRLGRALGGAESMREYLIREMGIRPSDIHIEKPSGIGRSRMTARATIQVLHCLRAILQEHGMKLQDIMAAAGVDNGTLRGRFRHARYRGRVLGKTGTNSSKDGGVSTLAGVVMTRAHGPVFYAILNNGGGVMAYRRWQDEFLRKLIQENGGSAQALKTRPKSHLLKGSSSWHPSPYWEGLARVPAYRRKIRRRSTRPARTSEIRSFSAPSPAEALSGTPCFAG